MSGELSNLQKLSIFWDESAIYVLVYAGYALLVCAVFFIVEAKLKNSAGTAPGRLALYDGLLAVIAIASFTLSILLSGWYAQIFGGEIGAAVVAIAASALALYLFKADSIEQLALGYDTRRLPAMLAAGLLVTPYTLATLLVFLFASGMRN